ncbi:MAG: hypothetical protein M3Y58_03610 [Chloroflexota bacterium]|nr:hypothetical protein [Chloroflexota bacterium]
MDFFRHPSFWPQQIVNGLLIGGVYMLVALGFSIVWGILNNVNLAHGAFIMLGAFATFFIWDATHLDPFLILPVAAAISARRSMAGTNRQVVTGIGRI